MNKRIANFDVEIIRKSGLKNIYIRVKPPDGKITVSASPKVSNEVISNLIIAKSEQIKKAQERIRSQERQTKREYISGETFYLWGRPYMLKVIRNGRRYHVELMPDKIIFIVPEKSSFEGRKRALTEWYREELRGVVSKLIARCAERVGVEFSGWNIRDMKTCWGTCNTKKRIILVNLQLVKKPFDCLEYVLIHELVHLLERNHTKKFYALVEKFCPNWRESKRRLSSYPLDSIEQ